MDQTREGDEGGGTWQALVVYSCINAAECGSGRKVCLHGVESSRRRMSLLAISRLLNAPNLYSGVADPRCRP